MATPDPNTSALLGRRPRLSSQFRLQWEPAQEAHVLLYPEGMVKLNGSAGEILKHCNGQRTTAELIGALEAEFNTTGLQPDVLAFMAIALQQGWLKLDDA